MTQCIAVVDVGSSGVKATVWGDGGNTVVLASSTHVYDDQLLLLSPVGVFLAIEACLDEIAAQEMIITHLGFSSFGMSLVGLDSTGGILAHVTYQGQLTPPSPPLATPSPSSSSSFPIDLELFANTTGVPRPMHPSYAKRHMDALETEMPRLHRYTTFVTAWLERVTVKSSSSAPPLPISFSEASWWGLLDWRELRWAAEAGINLLGKLPPVCDYDEAELPPLRQEYAKRWPGLYGAKFHLAVVDGALATLAAGPQGSAVVTVATSAAVRVLVDSAAAAAGSTSPTGCFVHVLDRHRVVVGGGLTDGGSVGDLADQWLGGGERRDDATLLHRLDHYSIAALPVCLPFFSGERAPGWAAETIPASIIGLGRDTTRDEIKLAMMMGVAHRLGEIYERLPRTSSTSSPQQVFVSGSALMNSAAWRAVVSSALGGVQLVRSCHGESSSSPGKDGDDNHARDDTTARGVVLLIMEQRALLDDSIVVMTEPRSASEVEAFRMQRALQNRYYAGLLE